jgi:hypothetical protein
LNSTEGEAGQLDQLAYYHQSEHLPQKARRHTATASPMRQIGAEGLPTSTQYSPAPAPESLRGILRAVLGCPLPPQPPPAQRPAHHPHTESRQSGRAAAGRAVDHGPFPYRCVPDWLLW